MRWNSSLAKAAAIALAAVIVYVPAMRAGVVWDDSVFLGGDAFVKPPDNLHRIWLTTDRLDYFPLTDTSFWLCSRLWGAAPAAHHAVNILLHALTAILLWRILLRLQVPGPFDPAQRDRPEGNRMGGAWWAGLIFAVHPVNVESVAWISERKNTLSLFFCAACLLAYLRFEECSEIGRVGEWEIGKLRDSEITQSPSIPISQSPNLPLSHSPTLRVPPALRDLRVYLLSLFLFLLALLAKTSVVMLPVILLLCAWWRRGRISRKDLLRAAPFFALSAALGAVTVWFQHERAMAGVAVSSPPLFSSLAAAGWAVWFYLSKAFAPVGLCALYPGWDTAATADLSIVPAVLLAACFAIFWVRRRNWGRPFLFALGCYVVMLLPVLGFMHMYAMELSLVTDHFQYPALIAVIALAAGLAVRGIERTQPRLRELAPFAAAALVAVLGLHAWQQACTYENEGTLWTRVLELNPESCTAHNNLAAFLINTSGPLEDAVAGARGADRERLDRLLTAQYQKALEHARAAARLKRDHGPAYYNIGTALLKMGRTDEAEAALRTAVTVWPQYAGARFALGDALTQQGKFAEGAEQYARLLEDTPDFPRAAEARNNLARILASEGKISEAIAHYRAAFAGRPGDPRILDNLAWLLACAADVRFRNGAEAVALAERAHKLAGDSDVKSLDVLAAAYAETGRFDDAVRCARKASELAASSGQERKAERIRKRVALYESRQPVRLGPGIPIE